MSTPRVLLVNPRMSRPPSARLPLSLLALGAALEGRAEYRIVDGNVDPDPVATALASIAEEGCDLVGVTVMPGPQVAPAIAVSQAIRAAHPRLPIVWGGYFPTLYPASAINAPYVDMAARGQGQETLVELLERVLDAGGLPAAAALGEIEGLSFKDNGGVAHNPERSFKPPDAYPPMPYHRLDDVETYMRPSFMGTRTGVHEAAIGCRYRCTFCGVVSMFNGVTRFEAPGRLEQALLTLRDRYGANAMQFYDNNFFDREETSLAVLEVMARVPLPWWCYARADTLANFSPATWRLIEKSRLTMAYIGAEAASDAVLASMKKGTRVEQTFEVAQRCREHGVIPEFSFVLGGPEDPEGEIEKTLAFIKRIKAVNPDCEVVLYFYSPTPQRRPRARRAAAADGRIPVLERYGPEGPELPATPEEWTEPEWLEYVCHQDAPWLTPRVRRRVRDFATVLGCRFPTAQDHRLPAWGKTTLRSLASWRWASGVYGRPWELELARRALPLKQPQRESL